MGHSSLEVLGIKGSNSEAESGQDNHSHVLQSFKEAGYAVASGVFSPHENGVPQLRNRVLYIAIHAQKYWDRCAKLGVPHPQPQGTAHDGAQRIVDDIVQLSLRLRAKPTSHFTLENFMLAEDHLLLQHERDQAMSQSSFRKAKAARQSPKWPDLHKQVYEKHGLRWLPPEQNPRTCVYQANPWFANLNPRERDIVMFADAVHPLDSSGPEETMDLS